MARETGWRRPYYDGTAGGVDISTRIWLSDYRKRRGNWPCTPEPLRDELHRLSVLDHSKNLHSRPHRSRAIRVQQCEISANKFKTDQPSPIQYNPLSLACCGRHAATALASFLTPVLTHRKIFRLLFTVKNHCILSFLCTALALPNLPSPFAEGQTLIHPLQLSIAKNPPPSSMSGLSCLKLDSNQPGVAKGQLSSVQMGHA